MKRIFFVVVIVLVSAPLFSQGMTEEEMTLELLRLMITNDHEGAEQFGKQLMWGLILQGMKEEQSFPATHRVSENLRIRETPSLSSETITVLNAGAKVRLLQKGAYATIDGITAPWVKVDTANGTTGWCFSGYLVEF